jgi:hypothetical protein
LFNDPASAKKKQILDEVLGRPYKQGKEYLYPSRCCGHHKSKLSINFEKNAAKCWACDWRTKNLRRLVRRWGDISHINRWKDFDADIELGDLDNLFAKEEEIKQRIDLPNVSPTLISYGLQLPPQTWGNRKRYSLLEDRLLRKWGI